VQASSSGNYIAKEALKNSFVQQSLVLSASMWIYKIKDLKVNQYDTLLLSHKWA